MKVRVILCACLVLLSMASVAVCGHALERGDRREKSSTCRLLIVRGMTAEEVQIAETVYSLPLI
ncbi:hypothetical protein KQI82_00025 [Oscillibacter sp. MSJ-2]|uniref:Uncharacterized protein n=1 Tax=Dysosmobacter acutus TaxID=2841504 RepID=A0ABS6F4Y4_9FIRM|nr:hypothetical protein [Dysosmobacter acutus]MBU5625320.1 hypothetical protein [Dysosmobacter acutus]